MGFDLNNINIPNYENFTREANDKNCIGVNTRNIIAEILGGEYPASREVQDSFKGKDVLIEGDYAIILRYKREKDGKSYPAIVMGFDLDDENGIIIRHIQGTKQKRIAYRFASGFDYVSYFVRLIKENFTDKGITVTLPDVPTNLEGASYGGSSIQMYSDLQRKLKNLNASIK